MSNYEHDPDKSAESITQQNRSNESTPAADLTAFQFRLLASIAIANQRSDRPIGQEVKQPVEDYIGGEVFSSRLYPNLETLRDKGLIAKLTIDGRTNGYELTDAGRGALATETDFLMRALSWRAFESRDDGIAVIGGGEQ